MEPAVCEGRGAACRKWVPRGSVREWCPGKEGPRSSLREARLSVLSVCCSGGELGGKVVSVSDELTHLGQLTGKEYYDAVIVNSKIEAVIIRTK